MPPQWTNREVEKLQKLSRRPAKFCLPYLPGRSYAAIVKKKAEMGLIYEERRRWSEEDLDFLLQNPGLTHREAARALCRTMVSVRDARKGLRKKGVA